jgi:MFS family permease
MLDLSLFENRLFRTANLTAFFQFCAMMGILFLVPLFLQDLRGISAFESGLVTFAQPLTTMVMLRPAGMLYNRVGPRWNLILSSTGIVLTSLLLLLVGMETDLWWIRGIMLFRGVFSAFNIVSMQAAAFAEISREKMGRASSLFSTQRQAGAAFGVAALGTVLVMRAPALVPGVAVAGEAAQQATLAAFHDAFLGAAVFGVISAIFAARIQNPRLEPPSVVSADVPKKPALEEDFVPLSSSQPASGEGPATPAPPPSRAPQPTEHRS